jgi:hypothetical protein
VKAGYGETVRLENAIFIPKIPVSHPAMKPERVLYCGVLLLMLHYEILSQYY